MTSFRGFSYASITLKKKNRRLIRKKRLVLLINTIREKTTQRILPLTIPPSFFGQNDYSPRGSPFFCENLGDFPFRGGAGGRGYPSFPLREAVKKLFFFFQEYSLNSLNKRGGMYSGLGNISRCFWQNDFPLRGWGGMYPLSGKNTIFFRDYQNKTQTSKIRF